MGLRFTIATDFGDPALPVRRDDPILSDGSLFLWDPTHSLGAFTGVPADGGLMPNIAWQKAAAIIGSGDATTLGAVLSKANIGTAMALERSSKGGIHGIPSRVNMAAAAYAMVQPSTAIQAYIHAQTADDLYFSVWIRLTRAQVSASPPQSIFHKAESTTNYLFFMQDGGHAPSSGVNYIGNRETPATTMTTTALGTPMLRNIATTGFTGTKNALSNGGIGQSGRGLRAVVGAGDAWTSFNLNKAPGFVIERIYVESLTVSGRTYAEVDALDVALFNTAHAIGGRWYGDTYTNPTTFA